MKIVIGYDGSACSDVAIRDLRRAGLPGEAEAVVMSVADLVVDVPYETYELTHPAAPVPGFVGWAREAASAAISEARASATRGAELLRSGQPNWRVAAEAQADSPYWALIRKAAEWHADLLVVGSHGRSLIGRIALGSVSQHVLNYARCSVRIGRCRGGADFAAAPTPPEGPPRLILAVDGSADADAAAEVIARRAWPAGTAVRIVTALDLKLAMLLTERQRDDAARSPDPRGTAWLHANALAERLCGAGLAAAAAVIEGDPKHVLVREADEWGADCIVLGARGHGRRERLLLGSVSSAVAARAACSVEVVRPV